LFEWTRQLESSDDLEYSTVSLYVREPVLTISSKEFIALTRVKGWTRVKGCLKLENAPMLSAAAMCFEGLAIDDAHRAQRASKDQDSIR
jgi:hypothetical protein